MEITKTNSVIPLLSTHHATHEPIPTTSALPNSFPSAMALLELEATEGDALFATLEEMGMALAGRWRDNKSLTQSESQLRRQQALLALIQRLREQDDGFRFLSQTNSESSEQETVRQILSLAQGLAAQGLSKKKQRQLDNELASLMESEGWEVSLFGMMELGTANKSLLAPIARLFQQAMDERTVSLSGWFQRIADWPDRRRRLRVLLRMMAFELSLCVAGEQQVRLAATMSRLRRLLLFLGMEQECIHPEQRCQLPQGTLLPLLIDIIAESWVFDDWLRSRLLPLVPSTALFNRLLQHLDALLTRLPDPCFSDADQREQILIVVRGLKGDQVLT